MTILGSWMPSLAAAIVVRATQGPEAVSGLFARLVRFKLPARWYLASLIPLGVVALAVLGYRLSGGAPEGGAPLTFTVWFNLLVINLLTARPARSRVGAVLRCRGCWNATARSKPAWCWA